MDPPDTASIILKASKQKMQLGKMLGEIVDVKDEHLRFRKQQLPVQ